MKSELRVYRTVSDLAIWAAVYLEMSDPSIVLVASFFLLPAVIPLALGNVSRRSR